MSASELRSQPVSLLVPKFQETQWPSRHLVVSISGLCQTPMPRSQDSIPCVSFIGIVDFTENAIWQYCSQSVHDLLGFEPHELVGHSSIELVHPDELTRIKQLHYNTIQQDKAAVLAYLRMRHKDPFKGYVLCSVTRTVVHNVLAGSVSYAIPGPKAMHNASTAQEVIIITPSAQDFQFRRWNDPSPMQDDGILNGSKASLLDAASSSISAKDDTSNANAAVPIPTSYPPLPTQSIRTLLILDRFSINCHILYCSNDSLLATTAVMGRSFYDFVVKKDEALVRSWVDVIKSWGVNESGQPSDGGFGFGRFTACPQGRDSSATAVEPASSRRDRREDKLTSRTPKEGRRRSRADSHPNLSGSVTRSARSQAHALTTSSRSSPESEFLLDAIFSAHSDGLMVIIRKAA